MLKLGIFCVLLISITVLKADDDCGQNGYYNDCGSPCASHPTCKNQGSAIHKRAASCITVCEEGCVCKSGFVKDDDGSCVKPENCKNRQNECGLNEYFDNCGSSCPSGCGDRFGPPQVCLAVCVSGCFCKPEFLRDRDGSCVLPHECNQRPRPVFRCGRNETVSRCISPCNTCRQRGRCAIPECKLGCDCRSGYFKNIDGTCISARDCPSY